MHENTKIQILIHIHVYTTFFIFITAIDIIINLYFKIGTLKILKRHWPINIFLKFKTYDLVSIFHLIPVAYMPVTLDKLKLNWINLD